MTDSTRMKLQKLNEKQREAVFSDGNSLVLAGPGTGKTRVVVNKVARLLLDGVKEENVFLSTFTKSAAKEMKERIQEISGKGKYMETGTLHSIFFGFVKENYERIGYVSPHINVYEDKDRKEITKGLVEEIAERENIPLEKLKHHSNKKGKTHLVDLLVSNIDTCRREIKSPSNFEPRTVGVEFVEDAEVDIEIEILVHKMFREVYDKYIRLLIERNAIDYMGMLYFPYNLLQDKEEVRVGWQSRFSHVLIDEGQDLSKIQWKLIDITSEKSNLTIVGDEQQTIYGWRGASSQHLKEFKEKYEPEVFIVTKNYRSQPSIITLGNKISEGMQELIRERKLETTKEDKNCKVESKYFSSEWEEFDFIISKIQSLSKKGYDWGDFVIGLRSRTYLNTLMRMMVKQGIPVITNRGTNFFERREIKSITNYLKAIVNPFDDYLIRQILLDCKGIGEKRVSELMGTSPLIEEIKQLKPQNKYEKVAQQAISTLTRLTEVNNPVQYILRRAPRELAQDAVKRLEPEKEPKKRSYLAKDCRSYMKALEEALMDYSPLTPKDVSSFLEDMVGKKMGTEKENKVLLTTAHGTKGQEWKVTFYPVMADGIFPNYRSIQNGGLEEEKRLFFVCATRPKDKVFFSYTLEYSRYSNHPPSRFLRYLEDE